MQSAGGALPGRISRDVAQLRGLGLLCGHITAAPAYGGEQEALQRRRGARRGGEPARLGCGDRRPGSRDHRLRHSSRPRRDGGARQRPRGAGARNADACSRRVSRAATRGRATAALSHHTRTVLELLLGEVEVPVPGSRGGRSSTARDRPAPASPADRAGRPRRLRGERAADPGDGPRPRARTALFFAAALAVGARACRRRPLGSGGRVMERIDSKIVYEGKLVTVRIDTFRDRGRLDAASARSSRTPERSRSSPTTRSASSWSASRARRSGVDDLLELPAGKLDVEGETPLQCAQRELEEEVGLQASDWRRAEALLHQPRVHRRGGPRLLRHRAASETEPDPDEGEEIEIVAGPARRARRRRSRAAPTRSR